MRMFLRRNNYLCHLPSAKFILVLLCCVFLLQLRNLKMKSCDNLEKQTYSSINFLEWVDLAILIQFKINSRNKFLIILLPLSFQFRKRVFQWCSCSSSRSLLCCWCCKDDKQRHLEKCQSFYTGLSRSSNGNLVMGPNGLQCSTPNASKTRFFTGPNRVRHKVLA